MGKTVYLFSGQGAQYMGMGLDFAGNREVKDIFSLGSEILGWDIISAIRDKSKEELGNTLISQPAIFSVSLAALKMAESAGLKAQAVAGHSLGEYAALVASKILSAEEGFKAIKLRCEAMNRAALKNPGGMAAVLGAESEQVDQICKEISKKGADYYIISANYNSPAQTVISGTVAGLQTAIDMLKAAGIRKVIRLAVSAAFHSLLMESAANEVESGLKNFKFKEPIVEFYSNINGNKLEDYSDMPGYLGKHICAPVRFVNELTALKNNGYDTFIELGPDKILTGLVKKTLLDVKAVNIENNETLNAVKKELLC
ncbi:MAG: ACP S-malonyltransferase [Eubacterium sp.]|jgi:[acyl-carrier-protein] S-malonyltransferase|nr:ACP S-malonyltransferase [Eubacterium sp.]